MLSIAVHLPIEQSEDDIMARTHRTTEQQLAMLQEQERKLKERRRAAEEKLRRQREREAARNLANLVQVLKRHDINKLTPERLEKALATIA
jgi:DNA invertase Pin-like site-specific DNA recombinase